MTEQKKITLLEAVNLALHRAMAEDDNVVLLGEETITVHVHDFLDRSERFWLGLQADYDLEEAHRVLGDAVARIERIDITPENYDQPFVAAPKDGEKAKADS